MQAILPVGSSDIEKDIVNRPPLKYAAYYRKRGTRKWKRKHPDIAGSKQQILKCYQTWLIYGEWSKRHDNIERQIHPIPRKKIL